MLAGGVLLPKNRDFSILQGAQRNSADNLATNTTCILLLTSHTHHHNAATTSHDVDTAFSAHTTQPAQTNTTAGTVRLRDSLHKASGCRPSHHLHLCNRHT
jgi:hypothetical protein